MRYLFSVDSGRGIRARVHGSAGVCPLFCEGMLVGFALLSWSVASAGGRYRRVCCRLGTECRRACADMMVGCFCVKDGEVGSVVTGWW